MEQVQELKEKVKINYRHFTCFNWQRSQLGSSLKLEQLSEAYSDYLVAPFLEVESKETMWGCKRYENQGPNGMSFTYIKELLDAVKDYFVAFLEEILVHGSNNSFIVMVPKIDNP